MRLLIIDDEKELLDFLKPALEDEGYTVDTAEDGKKGLFYAQTNDYDLIILDLNLPKESGQDICYKIREDNNPVPILVLSNKTELFDKIELLALGSDDYMTKPFSFIELSARIKAILRRPRQIKHKESYKIGNLELDPKTYRANRGGRIIYFTKKEFNILAYLIENQDEIVTRASLTEKFWDINANPLSNTIESHISKIRNKVDGPKEKKLIHTIPKRGYKINL